MTRAHWIAWGMAVLWASLLLGLQGTLARGGFGAWTPDLALAAMIALAARVPSHELPKLGLAFALARAGVSIEPPVAVFAAAFAVVALARVVRSVVEIDSALLAGALAFPLSLAQSAWFALVHRARLDVDVQRALDAGDWSASGWRVALATALVATLLGGVFAGLPGLSPLRRRRTWAVAGSSR
jgi:hypothetical protein